MINVELQMLTIARALVEVAGMFLLARGALFVLAGAGRERNVIYQLFCVVTRPVITATRFVMPRFVVDKHIPLVAFFILFWLWIALAYAKQAVCAAQALVCA